jgi:hypothetical protein
LLSAVSRNSPPQRYAPAVFKLPRAGNPFISNTGQAGQTGVASGRIPAK